MSGSEEASNGLPTVSAVMATYNRCERLLPVVEAVLADPALHEFVVVVDGSLDGSIELLGDVAKRDARLRPLLIENRGPSGALVAGIEQAGGEVVLWLDDDVLVGPHLARGHARHHALNEGLVVIGYMPVERPNPRRPGDFATLLYADEYERMCVRHEREPERILMNLWGGHVSLRRADCLRVGLDSPHFPWRYHQDQELGLRLREAGLTGVFDRSLAARHLHRISVDGFARDARAVGASAATILALHPAAAESLDPNAVLAELPPAIAAIVRLARRQRAYRLVSVGLSLLTRAAGAVRAFDLETLAGRLARRVEIQYGILHGADRKGH